MCRNFLPHARCNKAHAGRTTPDGQLFGIAREKTPHRVAESGATPRENRPGRQGGKEDVTRKEFPHKKPPRECDRSSM